MTTAARPVLFVILSAPRCGSWLLWTSLEQHPHAALYGELFNDEIYAGTPSALVPCSPPMIARPVLGPGERADDYLANLLGQFATSSFAAVGFKLLYGQSRQNPDAARLWPYLERRTDIRVVHVVRENVFEAYLSLQTALVTHQWAAQGRGPARVPPLHITAQDCRAYFEDQLRLQREIRRRFRHHDVLELEYERDLVGTYAATMKRTQAFLALPPQRVSPVLKRQARGSIAQRVVNYGELRDRFAATPFARFFAEPQETGGAV